MKYFALLLIVLLGNQSVALAQSGGPSGRGSTTGDPAASSENPRAAPSGTTGAASGPSGSGSSTSGGRADNNDHGRDKMPDSDISVKPAPGKPAIPPPRSQ